MNRADDMNVPPIVAGRFGLEQRCAYRHHDLYHEEVPEIDFETAISRPDLGAGCVVRTFLLLGDQNAGKSTMLHSFCREDDPNFLQLSSLLPVLAASFINTRLVPRSALGADLNERFSAVRDEMPFMDTDIARGLVMLTLENFAFFCNEFGISSRQGDGVSAGADGAALEVDGLWPGGFHSDARFVALQFVELGGDHLDRLLRFAAVGGDLAAVRAAEGAVEPCAEGSVEEAFWADVNEVLLGSLRLLRDTTRTAYFINCAVLFPDGRLDPRALRSMLRKLRFLDGALGGGRCDVMFCCSRAPSAAGMDAPAAWSAARAECAAFAREELGASAGAAALRLLPLAPPSSSWEVGDEGLDLGAIEEVVGEAAQAWRLAEEGAAPLLALIREMLRGLALPAVRATRLRLLGVHAVRNLSEGGASLCVPSVIRNIARFLQRVCQESRGEPDEGLAPHVAELILRCMAGLRYVEAPKDSVAMVLGRWVTCSDLADHLEELEEQHEAVPLPELATLRGWSSAAAALVDAGVCVQSAPGGRSGLPLAALEIAMGADLPWIRIAAASAEGAPEGDREVIFVTGSGRPRMGPEAIGLPLDPELFSLLSSEPSIAGVCAHLARRSAARFSFSAGGVVAQLQAIHRRLLGEVHELVAQSIAWALGDSPALPGDALERLLHAASDAWQAQALLGAAADSASPAEPAAKRVRGARPPDVQRVSERLRVAAGEDGVAVALAASPAQPACGEPLLQVRFAS